jgi:hypothetical protein
MQESMDSGESDQLKKIVAMLRQILDNLLAYSFSQEDAMEAIQKPEKKLAFF